MAVGEIFLAAFLQVVFEKLLSPELIKFARREGVYTAVKKLERALTNIQAVLEDAEKKQIADGAVKGWLYELRDLAYDVDDILDEFATEALRHKIMAEPASSTSKVRSLIPTCCTSLSPREIMSNMRMGSKIKEITSRLEDISKRITELGLMKISGETSTKVWQRPPTTSLVDESSVYGRDKDKEEIVQFLLRNEPTDQKVGVISIVGMGGVGKTTLAQLVYNDERVKQCFDPKAWVCVSDEFDVMKITNTILQSDYRDLNQAQIKLKEALTGKRFLIVLDDVWNKKYVDWEILRSPFVAGEQGSRVLVTTRDKNVALMMSSNVDPYNLEHLSNSDCWSVFVQHAFENRNIDANPKLKEIGEKIVEKCRGLPLAIKTLAGILRHKQEDAEWEDILNSKIWDLRDDESDVLPALRLSYHHLPPPLKRCFAYSSILPKDYEFEEKQIVLLWLAEGFLQQPKETMQLEDLGGEYFRDLVSRSFFQQSNRNKTLFIMHDLINDLAQWVVGEICFKLEDSLVGREQCKIPQKVRHSSYISNGCDGVKRFEAFYKFQGLRTFLPLDLQMIGPHYLTNNVLLDLLPKLSCLRVLSLSEYRIFELPDSIGELKHLRYLDLSRTAIRSLPESTSTLYNLQTINLKLCFLFKKFPTKMRNLINLRHLDFTGANLIQEMPPRIGLLTSLQTLSKFFVGRSSDTGIRELRKLSHLRGALSVSNLENVIDAQEAQEANLNDKLGLDVLKLEWSSDQDHNSRDAGVEIDVLDMLQPQKKLKELTIKGFSGTRFPTWIGHHSFSNMVLLRLEDCVKCTALPPLGQLPMLKDLCIRRMNGVKSVGSEFYGVGCPKPFPSLETLSFDDMQKWEDWLPCGVDGQVEVFLYLHELSISKCPKLLGELPHHLPYLEKLIINECQQLVVSVSSLPKLCKLDIKDCQVVLQSNTVVDLSSLKSMVVSNVSNLMCLTEGYVQSLTTVEDLEIKACKDLTLLWQKEGGLLQYLTSLRRLRIEDCPNFVSLATEEAEQQQQEQQLGVGCKLESLELCSCDNLEKLRGFPETDLPSSLKELKIAHCGALKSLHPLMMQCGQYASLESLCIENCYSLTSIAIRQLPSTLKRLEIINCKNLKCLVDEEECSVTTPTISSSLRDNSVFLLEDLLIWNCESLTSIAIRQLPSTLKRLQIEHCKNLKCLVDEEEGSVTTPTISSSLRDNSVSLLERLSICNCESLTSLSSTGELPATLKSLWISDCPKLESVVEMLRNNTSLEQITLFNCENLESFPDGGLPAAHLTSLSISGCEKLEALPDRIHNLTSLQTLCIWRCSGIVSFPEEGFPSNLTFLRITDLKICKPLFQWGLHRLTSLRTLAVGGGCPDVVSFPEEEEGMMLPTSLTSLSIENFPNLEYLSSKGFQNLSSLEDLSISSCPKLKSFPQKGLPPSLLQLHINDCPLLKQRCKKDQGRDWPKISHIPCVMIDYRFIFDPVE